jgi:hypothetical protein
MRKQIALTTGLFLCVFASVFSQEIRRTGITKADADNRYLFQDGTKASTGAQDFNVKIRLAAGTAAAPSYTFIGDEDTGLFRSAIDTLGFTAGGVGIFDVSLAGGITVLDTSGSGGQPRLSLPTIQGYVLWRNADGTKATWIANNSGGGIDFYLGATTYMGGFVTSSGNAAGIASGIPLLTTDFVDFHRSGDSDTGFGRVGTNIAGIYAGSATIPRVRISSTEARFDVPANLNYTPSLASDATHKGYVDNEINIRTNRTAGVSRNAAFSVPDVTWTEIPFDTEQWDALNIHNTANGRATPGRVGKYQVSAGVSFATNVTGIRGIAVHVNGVLRRIGQQMPTVSGSPSRVSMTATVNLTSTVDYISIFVYQNSGGALVLDVGEALTWMDITAVAE